MAHVQSAAVTIFLLLPDLADGAVARWPRGRPKGHEQTNDKHPPKEVKAHKCLKRCTRHPLIGFARLLGAASSQRNCHTNPKNQRSWTGAQV